MTYQTNTTQQYLHYMFRSKLGAIIGLITIHTYAGAGTKTGRIKKGFVI